MTGDSFSQGLEFDAEYGYKFMQIENIERDYIESIQPPNGNTQQ